MSFVPQRRSAPRTRTRGRGKDVLLEENNPLATSTFSSPLPTYSSLFSLTSKLGKASSAGVERSGLASRASINPVSDVADEGEVAEEEEREDRGEVEKNRVDAARACLSPAAEREQRARVMEGEGKRSARNREGGERESKTYPRELARSLPPPALFAPLADRDGPVHHPSAVINRVSKVHSDDGRGRGREGGRREGGRREESGSSAHLMISHDPLDLNDADEGEDLQILMYLLVRRAEEELSRQPREPAARSREGKRTHLIELKGRGHPRVQPDGVPR